MEYIHNKKALKGYQLYKRKPKPTKHNKTRTKRRKQKSRKLPGSLTHLFQQTSPIAGDDVNTSLLQYAGDALFFGEWSKANVKRLLNVLDAFYEAFGLKININKSRILVLMSILLRWQRWLDRLAVFLIPSVYLSRSSGREFDE